MPAPLWEKLRHYVEAGGGLFVALGVGMLAYGASVTLAVALGSWNRKRALRQDTSRTFPVRTS